METEKKNAKGAAVTGVIAAVAASSCCIPPVIAAIAGAGGAAGNLSWMESFRPYLIGLAIIAISYAWYDHMKTKAVDDCGCDVEKPKWYQTKGFLIGMTLFAVASIAFPYYSGTFFPDNKKEVIIIENSNVQKINVKVEGMTCDACQDHVNHAVNELPGIVNVTTSYDQGNTIVQFDESKTSIKDIKKAINTTGYVALEKEENLYSVIELIIDPKGCGECIDKVHVILNEQNGVVEVCTYYDTDKQPNIIALVSFDDGDISIKELTSILTLKESVKVESVSIKDSFYE